MQKKIKLIKNIEWKFVSNQNERTKTKEEKKNQRKTKIICRVTEMNASMQGKRNMEKKKNRKKEKNIYTNLKNYKFGRSHIFARLSIEKKNKGEMEINKMTLNGK